MNLKKILATVVTISIMLSSMGIVAFAEGTTVASFADFKAAVEAGESVVLTSDITTDAAINISGKTVSIDLNGKTLSLRKGDNKLTDAANVEIKNGTINIDDVVVKGNAIICLDEYEKTLQTVLTLNDVDVIGENYSSAYGVFYIGESSVLNVNGGNWILKNDLNESGGVFKADASGAAVNINGATMDFYNVRRGVTYAATKVEDSSITINGDEETSEKMEHGFNRSPLTIKNSEITLKNLSGRGITVQNGDVTVDATSKISMTNCVEATIEVRNGKTLNVEDGADVVIDKEATVSGGGIISGIVKVETPSQTSALAKIGNTEYTTSAELFTALKSASGNVDVEIYGKIETDGVSLSNSNITELNFIGMEDDAEICVTSGLGYIDARGINFPISYSNLDLSKTQFSQGIDGWLHIYFSTYSAGDVTYTDCSFPDGVTAMGSVVGTTVTFNDCTFNNNASGMYSLWINGNGTDVDVNGGTFSGVRGAKLYAEDNSVFSNLTIENATFSSNITEKAAVVLTRGESITISNTTFNNTTDMVQVDEDYPSEIDGKSVIINNTSYVVDGENKTLVDAADSSLAKIGDTGYETVAAALAAAQAAGMQNVEITLVGETTLDSAKALEDTFDLCYATAFDSVTFTQEDPSKVYYIDSIYTGSRNNGGNFKFDGVNMVVTGQYMFEGNVKLTNNSVVKSVAEANCFIYNGKTTVEPGSKLQGVIEDLRGGELIIDGGREDGEFNTTPDMQDAILVINWSGDSITLNNGAYLKVNSANEVGRMTVNSGTELNINDSKLDSCQWIDNNGTINIDAGSLITTPQIKGAGVININASGMKGKEVQIIKANMSGFTGKVNINGNADYAITDTGIVLTAKSILQNALTSKAQASGLEAFSGETGGIKWCSYSFLVNMNGQSSISATVSVNGNEKPLQTKNNWDIGANIDGNTAFGVVVTGVGAVDSITVDVQ